ncbi:hypothetical protein HOY82DRAFT_479125 [Tuber indicum]|nr:hypothetical protein HOY82DRAFT_479125 [Tuber indicum]
MVPPPIQSKHRMPITYGRISHSSSTNFKVFQDTVEGRNRNEETRATEIVPRRVRASGLLPSLPPMAEQSFQRSEFNSIHHIGDDIGGDPFADPPALNPQASAGLVHTKEVKQSSLSRKVALAEKSANYPIPRNTTVAITSDAASPSGTDRTSGPPPRPRKIRHYAPSLGDQDLSYLLSPSKARSPISEDNFRRSSTGAGEREVNRLYSTPPAGSGIDQHGMADGNTRASIWVRDKAGYLMKKTTEKMGSSPPNARCKSHREELTPTTLGKTSRGGVRKNIFPRYSVERMKRRRKGYDLVPATTDCGSGYESNGNSSVKDPFGSGQDGDFEHGIFAGESSDYLVEIPKKRRNAQEPNGWGTRAQSTQNLLAQVKEMNPFMKEAGTRYRSRNFKYDAELEDRNSGEDRDEREALIAGAAESLMAYMSDSYENVPPGPVVQSTSKSPSWSQLRDHRKNKSKKQAGKPPPPENKRNSRSKFLASAGDTDTDSSVGLSAKGSPADVAQKSPEGIPTVHTPGGIKHHDVKSGKLVRNKKPGEDGLGPWDNPGGRKSFPDSLPVSVSPQNATYPGASQTGGTEVSRQGSRIPNAGIGKDTRSKASLRTRRMRENRRGKNGKPITPLEDSTFQGPIRIPRNTSANIVGNKSVGSHSHRAVPLGKNPPKSMPYNTKRKKDVEKKTGSPKVEMVCEDDDLDELQMDLPGMRI